MVLQIYIVIRLSIWWRVLKCEQCETGSWQALPGTEEPCPPGQGPLTQHLLCTKRDAAHALERKPTGNFPQPPFSTAEILLQSSLPNL